MEMEIEKRVVLFLRRNVRNLYHLRWKRFPHTRRNVEPRIWHRNFSTIILPEIGGISVLLGFFQSKGAFFVALAGCIGSISYKCWYASMSMTGVSRAMAINISYALWGILFSYLFTDVEITRTLILGAIGIFLGMFLVIGNPRDMMDLRKTN